MPGGSRCSWGLLFVLALAACSGRVPRTPLGSVVAFQDVSETLQITVLTEDGGRVDWGHHADVIAFDRRGEDGYFDVWVMELDGTEQRCLSCETPGLPEKHNGQPAWHPAGEWLVIQSEKAESEVRPKWSHPGRGVQNDLWLLAADGSEAHRLTEVPTAPGFGSLHPHFSSDGNVLVWSEMYEPARILTKDVFFGVWKLVAADFVLDADGPRLENRRELEPGDGPAFYESHGLSPDGSEWIFSANLDPEKKLVEINDIYAADAETGESLRRLTTHGYNEHASFSPDGSRVLFMSNAGNDERGTDWWLMDADTSNLRRLTRFNENRRRREPRKIAADASFGPDGRRFVGYLQRGVGGDVGQVVLVEGLP